MLTLVIKYAKLSYILNNLIILNNIFPDNVKLAFIKD